jgi:twitching motility protein PilT
MYSAIQTGQNIGMQTLDQNLKGMLAQGLVSKEEAQRKAAQPDTL